MPFITGVGQQVGAIVGGAASGVAAGVTGASDRMRIEPEQVDAAIAVFKDALFALESEVRLAIYAIQAMPPANDVVSTDAADAFNRVGYENADSAVAAWQGAVQQLRSIVEQLTTAKQTIMVTDAGNVSNFQVSS